MYGLWQALNKQWLFLASSSTSLDQATTAREASYQENTDASVKLQIVRLGWGLLTEDVVVCDYDFQSYLNAKKNKLAERQCYLEYMSTMWGFGHAMLPVLVLRLSLVK